MVARPSDVQAAATRVGGGVDDRVGGALRGEERQLERLRRRGAGSTPWRRRRQPASRQALGGRRRGRRRRRGPPSRRRPTTTAGSACRRAAPAPPSRSVTRCRPVDGRQEGAPGPLVGERALERPQVEGDRGQGRRRVADRPRAGRRVRRGPRPSAGGRSPAESDLAGREGGGERPRPCRRSAAPGSRQPGVRDRDLRRRRGRRAAPSPVADLGQDRLEDGRGRRSARRGRTRRCRSARARTASSASVGDRARPRGCGRAGAAASPPAGSRRPDRRGRTGPCARRARWPCTWAQVAASGPV